MLFEISEELIRRNAKKCWAKGMAKQVHKKRMIIRLEKEIMVISWVWEIAFSCESYEIHIAQIVQEIALRTWSNRQLNSILECHRSSFIVLVQGFWFSSESELLSVSEWTWLQYVDTQFTDSQSEQSVQLQLLHEARLLNVQYVHTTLCTTCLQSCTMTGKWFGKKTG